jgi:phospholipase D-like protein
MDDAHNEFFRGSEEKIVSKRGKRGAANGKALWVIVVLVAPYIGIFAYMISQGRGMAERNATRAQQVRDELRSAIGFSIADEIEKLDRLKKSGSTTADEYARLRAKLVR